jgi:hypothetical protein
MRSGEGALGERVAVERGDMETLGEEQVGIGLCDDGLELLVGGGDVLGLDGLGRERVLDRDGAEVQKPHRLRLELRDADLDRGRELSEDDVGGEVMAALLRGMVWLLEQPSPIVRNHHGILLLLHRWRGGSRLVVVFLHDAGRILEQSAPVVGELLKAGRREAPLPPGLKLVELPVELVEEKLERGIHGVDRESTALIPMLATQLGLLTPSLIQVVVQGTKRKRMCTKKLRGR